MPISMTRAEYEAKYGAPPSIPTTPVQTTPVSTAPVKMTHAEYMAKYGNQTTPTESNPGILATLAKPFQQVAASFQAVKNLGASAIGDVIGNKQLSESELAAYNKGVTEGYDFPTGKVKPFGASQSPVQNLKEAVGAGAEIGTDISGFSGMAKTFLGRVAQFGVQGALSSLGTGLNSNASASDVAKNTAISGVASAIGGPILAKGAEVAVNVLKDILPQRLVQAVLPKLKRGDTIQQVLTDSKGFTTQGLIDHSNESLGQYDSQIKSILTHPDVAHIQVAGTDVGQKTLATFPNSEYTAEDIFNKMRTQVPAEAKTITSLQKGEISIADANRLRSQVDSITYKTKIDSPEVRANKDVAAAFGNVLRNTVQTSVPETQPIFSKYSKEIAINKALSIAKDKLGLKPTLKDIVAATTGWYHGGVTGALEYLAIERGLTNPAVTINVAKALPKVIPNVTKLIPVGVVGASKIGQKVQTP